MQYGFFDDAAREYVIERPDTPRPWTNYLGDRHYGGIITNNAGGYSFHQSSAEGRLLRMRFNSVPLDQPGRYFYLRDRDNNDYWSASWQPVSKPLDQYKSTCRFGTGYAIITSVYDEIETETSFFVPVGKTHEVWSMRVTNRSNRTRRLSTFSFAEFTNEWNMKNDLMNLQYTQYISEATYQDGLIGVSMCGRLPQDKDNFANRDQSRWWWMAQVGAPVVGHDLDREAFVGVYNGFHNPQVVDAGKCSNSICYGDNPCGAMQSDIDLKPGESTQIAVVIGVGKAQEEGATAAAAGYGNPQHVADELDKLRKDWHTKLDRTHAQTPDDDFNHMVNVWNPYNTLMTFSWSRSCSLVYTGDDRDGFGFRDTVQDTVGASAIIPDDCGERLALMFTGQESTGGARPEVRPWEHQPGKMPLTEKQKYRSDDCLWFFNAVPTYLAETGDMAFLDRVLPYSDTGEATVMGHLRRAIEFNLERQGSHGLPCGLSADWNDCLKLGYNGESVFVAFQLRLGLATYADLATRLGQTDQADWATAELATLDATIQRECWDGDRFIWAFGEDGTVYGSQQSEEGKIYLNTQVWAVISGATTPEQTQQCLDSVQRELATEHGVMICSPPFEKASVKVMRAVLMQPGVKENGGIFSHTQSWAVLAETLRGHGDAAFQMYRSFMPSAYNDRADLREIEPYVHCQSTHSRFSPKFGVSRVPWLSGTAAWANYVATHHILGIRPELDGLRIDPCIPAEWPGFSFRRIFRGKILDITVENPQGAQSGVQELKLNGQPLTGSLIPVDALKETNQIVVQLGKPQ
ncbi:MAG: glycosyl hydrolase family 65 protein [Algisphaera sp.]